MARIILTHGIIGGLIVILAIIIGMLVGKEGFFGSQTFGYLMMLLAMSLIFVGVKTYRDKDLGGIIKFMPAFLMGLGIAAIAGLAYVVAWEAYLASTGYSFAADYANSLIEAKIADGVTGQELDDFRAETAKFVDLYGNPLFRLPITFIEIFPVGFLVALISAAILRKPEVLPAR